MGNMLVARVRVKGTRPFIWHAFGPDSIPLEKQERTGVAGNDPEEWRKTVRRTKEGQLYATPEQVFGMMKEAAKYTKSGKGSIQKSLVATLQVTDNMLLMNRSLADGETPPIDPEAPLYLDVRGVVNPANKARNVRYRVASSPGWELTFHLLWDKTIVSRSQVEAVLIDGGKLVGLGDGRSIGMGRYVVEEFTVENETPEA